MSEWSEWNHFSLWFDCLKFTSFDLTMGCRSSCTAGAEAIMNYLFGFGPSFL